MKKICSLVLIMTMSLGIQASFAQEVNTNTANTEEAISKEIVLDQKEEVLNISLEDAIKTAIENSKTIEIADLSIELKEVELSEAKHKEDKYEDAVEIYGSAFPYVGTTEGLLLDANMLSESAEKALEQEKLNKDAKIKESKYSVTKAYYGLLMTRKNLEIAENNYENTKRNTEITQKKFELGVASKSDLLFAQIALDESKQGLEDAKTNQKEVERAFNMALDLPLDKKINLTSSFIETNKTFDIENDIKSAYTTRLDYVTRKNMYELSTKDLEVNKAKYPSNTFVYKKKMRNKLMLEKALNAIEKFVEYEIRNKYDAIEKAKQQIQISKGTVEKAKEALRLKELSYESGLGTLIDVKEYRNSEYKAQLGLSNAITSYNLAIIEYEKVISIGSSAEPK